MNTLTFAVKLDTEDTLDVERSLRLIKLLVERMGDEAVLDGLVLHFDVAVTPGDTMLRPEPRDPAGEFKAGAEEAQGLPLSPGLLSSRQFGRSQSGSEPSSPADVHP